MKNEEWILRNTSSLQGRVIAVTGTTGGLGRELCRYLASLGASLILLDRNSERSGKFRDELVAEYGCDARCIRVDLEDVGTVRAAVAELRTSGLDSFIHNAGAYSIPRHTCDTGFDNVYQINFASVYYMIKELLPTLRAAHGRVTVVGSIAYRYSKTDPEDVDFSTRSRASHVYGNAKRQLMFALHELFRDERDVTLSVTHPGITFTNITAHYPKLIYAIIKHPMKVIFMKPRRAALSILRGVLEPCSYLEWIGPRVFDIWGLPKKRILGGVDETEREWIFKNAEEIYLKLK